jgi:hypothetical protein
MHYYPLLFYHPVIAADSVNLHRLSKVSTTITVPLQGKQASYILEVCGPTVLTDFDVAA